MAETPLDEFYSDFIQGIACRYVHQENHHKGQHDTRGGVYGELNPIEDKHADKFVGFMPQEAQVVQVGAAFRSVLPKGKRRPWWSIRSLMAFHQLSELFTNAASASVMLSHDCQTWTSIVGVGGVEDQPGGLLPRSCRSSSASPRQKEF